MDEVVQVAPAQVDVGTAGKVRRLFRVLKYPAFRRLWFAQITSEIAFHLLTFTLVIVMFELTNSNAIVSAFVVLIALPPILFSTFAGVVADSYDRKRILLSGMVGRFLLAIAALLSHEAAFLLLGVGLCMSVVSQFFEPAEVSSIPTVVAKEDLFTANSFYSFTRYSAFLIGYAAAGPILHRLGPTAPFFVVMTLYAFSCFWLSRLPKLDAHLKALAHPTVDLFHNLRLVWGRLKEGIAFLRESRIVFFIVLQVSFLFSVEKTFVSLLPSFSMKLLGFNPEQISFLLLLPTGIGTLGGVLVANRLKHRVSKSKMINIGMFFDAFVLSLIPFVKMISASIGHAIDVDPATVLPVFVFVMAIFSGSANPLIIISAQTALQERVPNEKRGRIFGNQALLMNSLSLIPVLGIGFLTTIFSLEKVIFGLGSLVMVMAFVGLAVYRRYALGTE